MGRHTVLQAEVVEVDRKITETRTLLEACEARILECESWAERFRRFETDETMDPAVTGTCVQRMRFRLEQELALWVELDERLTDLHMAFAHGTESLSRTAVEQ